MNRTSGSHERVDHVWQTFLSGNEPLRRLRMLFRVLPSPPRCKVCSAPFGGIAGFALKAIGKGPWERNPRFCGGCARVLRRRGPGGAEVELSLVFADVRGSTRLAESMALRDYARLINRFFATATEIFVRHDGVVDQLVGDEAIGLFLPGFAGPRHAHRAIEAAWTLLESTGHAAAGGPWLPLGVGVHTGVAFVGSVGSSENFTDFTALGDDVNVTARLAASAAAGEILVSDANLAMNGLDTSDLEARVVQVKGKSDPLHVTVLCAPPRWRSMEPS